MDQKLLLVEKLVNLFCHFEFFRPHAILHDATGAVRAHSGKGPSYCYMIGRGPNSCLLRLVTGLLFCLYVKLFSPSIFNSVDFRSSMSISILDIEPADINVFKELRVFYGNVQVTHFDLQKSTNPQSKQFGVQETCTKLRETMDVWNKKSFPIFFPVM